MQLLLRRHALCWIFRSLAAVQLDIVLLEILDIARQGVFAAIEDHVVGEFALIFGNFGVGLDVCRIDNCHVEARLHCMIQKHAVEHCPRRLAKTEAKIADAERGHHPRQMLA